ncbi:MAG: hypothetical protein KF832_19885 [Caldilineaceae bacterium]|nr:hypothetical protein [Caldilineaceae bacterium]
MRVCQYFATQGVENDPAQLVQELWSRYQHSRPQDRLADFSRFGAAEEI